MECSSILMYLMQNSNSRREWLKNTGLAFVSGLVASGNFLLFRMLFVRVPDVRFIGVSPWRSKSSLPTFTEGHRYMTADIYQPLYRKLAERENLAATNFLRDLPVSMLPVKVGVSSVLTLLLPPSPTIAKT